MVYRVPAVPKFSRKGKDWLAGAGMAAAAKLSRLVAPVALPEMRKPALPVVSDESKA